MTQKTKTCQKLNEFIYHPHEKLSNGGKGTHAHTNHNDTINTGYFRFGWYICSF